MATADTLEQRFIELIAQELSIRPQQVAAASALFAEKATVPFVARYRKEATGGLDDEVLEALFKRRSYMLELADRRDAILQSIEDQGKLTEDLEALIRAAGSKQELEDLYLPYKPKRRTRAQIARERGLEPLADQILAAAGAAAQQPDQLASGFIDPEKDVADADAALAGARDILAERLAENADHRAALRKSLLHTGEFTVRALTGKEEDSEAQVFKDYFDHSEPASHIPSHRMLAILRGEREGVLLSDLKVEDELEVHRLSSAWGIPLDTPCGRQVADATADGYKRLLRPSITNEVRGELRRRAEAEAIAVFRENLEALLMQSPMGMQPVMALDPGYRTGCKLAVVGKTGQVVATDVVYPTQSQAQVAKAAQTVIRLCKEHQVHAIAIGNGTGSRETERFARQAAKDGELKVIVAIVPETGASVYSASQVAREELPDLDVALRGAVSIARRLQDPMAELVKIDPKSMGVGQYQHDVDQKGLADELNLTVEGTVNKVGVELNTASPSLLRRVSGLSERLARNIVAHRDQNGPFDSRKSLLSIKGFGAKTFEQAAGFLRIHNAANPLDRTAVHPERYDLVQRMAGELGVAVDQLVGNPKMVASVQFDKFIDSDQGIGRFTLEDIKTELERPGRDPRPQFRAPEWRDDVTTIDDLQPGMKLEGRVSNVANFGAFVDIGVKRDGMVHLSQLSDEWVDDPRKVVKVGQIVKVQVLEVDLQRGRISLTMKSRPDATPRRPQTDPQERRGNGAGGGRPKRGRSNSRGTGKAKPGPSKPATVEDLMRKFNRR